MSSTASQDALDLASRNPLSFLPAAPVVLSYTNYLQNNRQSRHTTTYYSALFLFTKKNNSLSLDWSFHSNLHFTLLIIYSKSYLFCRESNELIVLFENSSFLCTNAISRDICEIISLLLIVLKLTKITGNYCIELSEMILPKVYCAISLYFSGYQKFCGSKRKTNFGKTKLFKICSQKKSIVNV